MDYFLLLISFPRELASKSKGKKEQFLEYMSLTRRSQEDTFPLAIALYSSSFILYLNLQIF